MKTGPDNEVEFYKHRAKLYRFRENNWKERGLGDVQLLRSVEQTTPESGVWESRVRVLLRQEKTGKIQANHYLTHQEGLCVLSSNTGNLKTWCYSCIDCSEDEPSAEKLAFKFRDEETAGRFKATFEDAMENLLGPIGADEAAKFLAELKEAGVGGESVVPGPEGTDHQESAYTAQSPKSGAAGVSGGSPGGTPAVGGAAGGSVFGEAGKKSQFGGLFGAPGGSSEEAAGGKKSGGLFASGGFGGMNEGMKTGGSLFGSGAAKKSIFEQEEEQDREEAQKEVWDVPGWAGSGTTLEVKKGEGGNENEDLLYSRRAKLFRMREGGMKERGLGDARIYRHRTTGDCRFVLKQEETGIIRSRTVLVPFRGKSKSSFSHHLRGKTSFLYHLRTTRRRGLNREELGMRIILDECIPLFKYKHPEYQNGGGGKIPQVPHRFFLFEPAVPRRPMAVDPCAALDARIYRRRTTGDCRFVLKQEETGRIRTV